MDNLAPNEIRYPYAIVRACSELPYVPAFIEMPDGFLRIVLKIVQKINLSNPFTEIFASRQTLAEESGKSLDSVHRAISWLEKANLIERERIARAGLRGSRSPLVPTLALLTALGLVDASGKAKAKSVGSKANTRHAPGRPVCTPCMAHRTDADAEAVKAVREPGAFTRIGSVFLPNDLLWLCGRGLSPFAVLGLMKHARAASQRLSDVVQTAHKYLEHLKSNQLFAYIRSLLESGRDFSAISRIEKETEEIQNEKLYLLQKAEIYEGRRFISKKSGRVYQVESGAVRESGGDRVGMAPFTRAFIEAVEDGRLTPCRGR